MSILPFRDRYLSPLFLQVNCFVFLKKNEPRTSLDKLSHLLFWFLYFYIQLKAETKIFESGHRVKLICWINAKKMFLKDKSLNNVNVERRRTKAVLTALLESRSTKRLSEWTDWVKECTKMRVYLMLTQLKEKKKKIERISIREPLETQNT